MKTKIKILLMMASSMVSILPVLDQTNMNSSDTMNRNRSMNQTNDIKTQKNTAPHTSQQTSNPKDTVTMQGRGMDINDHDTSKMRNSGVIPNSNNTDGINPGTNDYANQPNPTKNVTLADGTSHTGQKWPWLGLLGLLGLFGLMRKSEKPVRNPNVQHPTNVQPKPF